MTPSNRVAPPALPIDAKYTLRPGQLLERTIIANLIAHLARHGWGISAVHDGEQFEGMTDTVEAMNLIFDLAMSQVRFTKGEQRHAVLVVCGNGIDIIADYSYQDGDGDGFDAVMRAFDVEAFA